MATHQFTINGVTYQDGDEVQFQVLSSRGYRRGIFRGKYDDTRYHIQDIDNNWKMPGGEKYCFTLTPKDFYKVASPAPMSRAEVLEKIKGTDNLRGMINDGWHEAGRSFEILGDSITVGGTQWTPILYDDAEDPDFLKTNAIKLI